MRIRHLETFLLVADELHFGRAAARLRVAQPAVSQTIAALEKDVGTTLFDRSKRRVRLTAAGVVFRTEAEAILRRLMAAPAVARRAALGESGRLVVGFTAVCALGGLAASLTRFIRERPRVDVRLLQMGTREQEEALALGRIDIGFSVHPDEDSGLVIGCVTTDQLHAFLPEGHPLQAQERVAIVGLLSEPFLLMSRDSEPAVYKTFLRLCGAYDIVPNVVLEVDHVDTMLAFVAAGLGVSLAPSVVTALRLRGVVSRPVTPPIPAGISVIWPAEGPSQTGRTLLAHLKTDGLVET